MPALENLAQCASLPIDWDLTPEEAVTLYLEWGNNDWRGARPPVRSQDDVALYFVVDTWGDQPVVRLVRRSSKQAEDLLRLELPEDLIRTWRAEFSGLRGVFAPSPAVRAWLRQGMGLQF